MSITELSGALSNSLGKNVAAGVKMNEPACSEIHQINHRSYRRRPVSRCGGGATKMDAGLRRHDDETTAKFIGACESRSTETMGQKKPLN